MFTENPIHNGQFWTMFSHELQRQVAQKVDEIHSLEYVKAAFGQPITELCRETSFRLPPEQQHNTVQMSNL
jgi:hypothetical protein